ncbi:hypothetical protein [Chryseobacterium sp. CT-SW4]|uniref:hypothetical protein n=1 Tax=Chryseobacterium sp. SW-1 TaxID=3157343 RepID=UPI003B014101
MSQNSLVGTLPTSPDENGLNIRPDLRPESFFFLERNKNFSQSQANKFGISGADNELFRTTSIISSYTGKVYTICNGQILVQPCTADNNKINLILKPFSQPIKGLAIKYFIYRGLNKSDFFDNSGTINPASGATNITNFVDYIRKDYHDLYQMLGKPEPVFTAQHIGFPSTVAGEEQKETDLIDDYFFKISETVNNNGTVTEPAKRAYELPMIPRGIELGSVNGQIGIDVVLSEGDYTIENDPNPFKLNLKYARLAEHILNPDAGTTDYEKKLIKETATWFIDIAAFYGLHTHGKGKLYVNDQTAPLQTNDEIFGLIQNFYTAKTSYLYIQSNRQRSYNFYKNYIIDEGNSNNIKIGIDPNSLEEKKFEENWPLLELVNIPSVTIQLVTDNNDAAALYVKQGILNVETANEDYFIRGSNLLQEADENNNINAQFTKSITFDFTKNSGNNYISSFVQLIYEGKTLGITNVIPSLDPPQTLYLKDVDDIFGLINVVPHIQPKNLNELHYVIDQNLLLIDFDNSEGSKDITTVTTKKTEDYIVKDNGESLKRITYETLLNNIRQNIGVFFENRSTFQDNSNNGTITYDDKVNNFYHPEKPYYLQPVSYTNIEGKTVTSLILNLEDGSISSKKILGITNEENLKFIALINQHQFNNPKFYFRNTLENEAVYYTSPEEKKYRRYSLSLIGEDQEGKLIVVSPTDEVFVSTLDNIIFTSDEYAKWVPLYSDLSTSSSIYMKLPQI